MTTLITGASSGIGLELAHIAAVRGEDLILVARNISKLESLKSDIEISTSVKVTIIEKDLSLEESPSEIF